MKTPANAIRVLIVENDPTHAETTRRALMDGESACEVLAVGTLSEFRRRVASLKPDIVLMDLALPDGLALDVLEQPGECHPFPILVMIGHGNERAAVKAIKAGAVDYLVKSPQSVAETPQIVADALREWKQREEFAHIGERTGVAAHQSKSVREQMLRDERVNALTHVVSGVAHDFNNVLMPILGLSDLLIQYPDEAKNRSEVIKTLRIINSSARDGADVVRRLRAFYKPPETSMTGPVDPGSLVEDAIALTAPAWKAGAQAEGRYITFHTKISKTPQIPGNEVQLREALASLILNSVDAMPGGGKIEVVVEKKGAHVVIRISDSGVGMSPEILKKCMDPFFTTKGDGGSGLGLFLCQGIVAGHDGILKIESRPGKGTTISISLPITASPKPAENLHHRNIGGLHILLAEDKQESLDLVSRYLRPGEHSIEGVPDGLKALERIKDCHFDLLITDMAMPLMNGTSLAREAKKYCPGIMVIMLTGFGDFMQLTAAERANIDILLRKPLTKRELIGAIATMFSRQGDGKRKAGPEQ